MITTKRLDTPALIEEACALLHEVYIQQQNWQFTSDDPLELSAKARDDRTVLVDRFFDSAIVFGVFDGEQLVGCVRLINVFNNSPSNIENLRSQLIHSTVPLDEIVHCYEMQRMAVRQSYEQKGIVKRLLLACFQFCNDNQFHLLAFTHNGYLKSFFKKIAFPIKKEDAFRYGPPGEKAVNFYFGNFKNAGIGEVAKKLEVLHNDNEHNAADIFQALQTVEPILPTPFYWMSREGVVLGANELCLKAMGTTSEIIGKTPYAFYKPEFAAHILKHNAEVISKEEILSQEEWMEDITTKKRKCFSSIKAPLYNDDGIILGIVGTSLEITAQKEVEQLRKENERQRTALLQEKEKLIALAHKVAHDISSPLSALNMMMSACDELQEGKRTVIKKATESILDIANNLLSTYRNEEARALSDVEPRQPVLISDLIVQLLSEKKVQFSNRSVRFETNIARDAQFAFAQIQSSQFRRSMSNLINNAVDAVHNKSDGLITINLIANAELVAIEIRDNGKGMSSSTIQKMLARQSFTDGKELGHGLGLQQVWDTLDNNHGTMTVSSLPNKGSAIQLTFSRIDAASWIAQTIYIQLNGIVVILDDEESIHGAWDSRFSSYLKLHPNLAVHHFKQGQDALDFVNTLNSNDKHRVVFLSDYELLRQPRNGLQIVEASGIKHAILVTSYYSNPKIKDAAERQGVKLLPKQMASIIPIRLGN